MLKLTNPKSKVSMRKFEFEKVNLFVSSFDMTVFLLFLAIIFFCFLGKKDLDLPLPPYDVTCPRKSSTLFQPPFVIQDCEQRVQWNRHAEDSYDSETPQI